MIYQKRKNKLKGNLLYFTVVLYIPLFSSILGFVIYFHTCPEILLIFNIVLQT